MAIESSRLAGSVRRRASTLALAALALAFTGLLQGGTDNEKAHYAFVKALASGTAAIDETQYQVGDWVSVDVVRWEGNPYANKLPGLALLSAGPYFALRELVVRLRAALLWPRGAPR